MYRQVQDFVGRLHGPGVNPEEAPGLEVAASGIAPRPRPRATLVERGEPCGVATWKEGTTVRSRPWSLLWFSVSILGIGLAIAVPSLVLAPLFVFALLALLPNRAAGQRTAGPAEVFRDVPAPGPQHDVHLVVLRDGYVIGEDNGLMTFVDDWIHFSGYATAFAFRRGDVDLSNGDTPMTRRLVDPDFTTQMTFRSLGGIAIRIRPADGTRWNGDLLTFVRRFQVSGGAMLPPTVPQTGIERYARDLVFRWSAIVAFSGALLLLVLLGWPGKADAIVPAAVLAILTAGLLVGSVRVLRQGMVYRRLLRQWRTESAAKVTPTAQPRVP